MNAQTLIAAEKIAGEFLARCHALHKVRDSQKQTGEWIEGNPIEQGAVKRTSMELTRALATLRKPL